MSWYDKCSLPIFLPLWWTNPNDKVSVTWIMCMLSHFGTSNCSDGFSPSEPPPPPCTASRLWSTHSVHGEWCVGSEHPLLFNGLSVWRRFRDHSRVATGDPMLQFIFILIGNILCCYFLRINKPTGPRQFLKNSLMHQTQSEPGAAEQRAQNQNRYFSFSFSPWYHFLQLRY